MRKRQRKKLNGRVFRSYKRQKWLSANYPLYLYNFIYSIAEKTCEDGIVYCTSDGRSYKLQQGKMVRLEKSRVPKPIKLITMKD